MTSNARRRSTRPGRPGRAARGAQPLHARGIRRHLKVADLRLPGSYDEARGERPAPRGSKAQRAIIRTYVDAAARIEAARRARLTRHRDEWATVLDDDAEAAGWATRRGCSVAALRAEARDAVAKLDEMIARGAGTAHWGGPLPTLAPLPLPIPTRHATASLDPARAAYLSVRKDAPPPPRPANPVRVVRSLVMAPGAPFAPAATVRAALVRA